MSLNPVAVAPIGLHNICITATCCIPFHHPTVNAGVFRPLERVSDVRAFVLEALSSEAFPFNLLSPGRTLEDDNATLAELALVS